MKILANDGISPEAIKTLEEAGFEVITTKVAQNQLADFINKEGIEILLVRSATQAKKADCLSTTKPSRATTYTRLDLKFWAEINSIAVLSN